LKKNAVSDSGPLIALAMSAHLSLLRCLFGKILIPMEVLEELRLDTGLPGASLLAKAIYQDKWLVVSMLSLAKDSVSDILDSGERAAIALAVREKAVLIIDEKRGRSLALSAGVKVTGAAGILVAAKRKKLIARVTPVLSVMEDSGYYFSDRLKAKVLALAGE
jgi:hypothetical protein